MRNLTRTTGLAALALTLSLGLAACGNEDDDSGSDTSSSASSTPMESESMESTPMESDSAMTEGAAADAPFGAGCSAVPTSGAGSVESMATKPVATAASENPLLTTLVTAVKKAGLVDTLNSADALTVFAPTNDAFAKLPKKDLDALLKDKEALTEVLTHHVVAGELGPDMIGGEHETLAGDSIDVTGSGEDWTVDEMAKVVCGNVPTANAKVYVIDSVLMP